MIVPASSPYPQKLHGRVSGYSECRRRTDRVLRRSLGDGLPRGQTSLNRQLCSLVAATAFAVFVHRALAFFILLVRCHFFMLTKLSHTPQAATRNATRNATLDAMLSFVLSRLQDITNVYIAAKSTGTWCGIDQHVQDPVELDITTSAIDCGTYRTRMLPMTTRRGV